MPASSVEKPQAAAAPTAGVRMITLPVIGMSCAACQGHVERALRGTPGVREANVNLLTNSARVSFDASLTNPEHLIASVREAGYDAAMPADAGAPPENQPGEEGTLRAKAIVTLVAGAVVMALANAPGWLPAAQLPQRGLEWLMLAITLPGMIWGGGIVYRQAWTAAIHRGTNMNTLVALGTGAAFMYSLAATLAPGAFLRLGLHADVYYDAVLLILGFLLLGRWLDARAKRRTLDALHEFMRLQPQQARVLRNGSEKEVPLAEVIAGDIVVLTAAIPLAKRSASSAPSSAATRFSTSRAVGFP